MSDDTTTRRDFVTGRIAKSSAAESAPKAFAEPGADACVLTTFSKPAMACLFEFFFDAHRFPSAPQIANDALDLLEEIESELSVYRPESHISDVNRRACRERVELSAALEELIVTSLELYAATGGAFDITSGPLSKAWGFYSRKPIVPSDEQIASALRQVGSDSIDFDDATKTVRFNKPGLEINLASIGKGFALDRCSGWMFERGVKDFILHGGQSSVLARGCQTPSQPHLGWTIGLVHPILSQARIGCVRLFDRALGTSGCQRQFLIHRGRRLGHVIDPRTGWPVTHTLSATALAPTAAEADALATAFSVMTLDEVARFCAARPNVSAIIATPSQSNSAEPTIHCFNLTENEWLPQTPSVSATI
jgi:thiamine biosynthesis lipoprotein